MNSGPRAVAPTCSTLWIGGNLGPIGAACLASFVRRGHPVVLYCYDPPRDAPAGVELAAAASIIPSSRIIRHKETGSHALFSNLFRYELLRLGLGLWVDCDMYCVRRFVFDSEYVYGWARASRINNAVLRLPAHSPVLDQLIAIFGVKSPIPPWLSPQDESTLLARKLAGETFELADLPWGSTGPLALTYLVTEAGLAHHALPPTVFYPVPYDRGPLLLKRGVNLAAMMTPKTLGVHLWNETLHRHVAKAERGSAVDRLLSQGTLFDESLIEAAPE